MLRRPRLTRPHLATVFLIATLLTACGRSEVDPTTLATPAEVPIGGVRASITRQDLQLARERMPGGLLEPCWLPDGFELVHVFFGAPERSTDLYYQGDGSYVHVWQTQRSAAELGRDDPVAMGSPIAIDGNVAWRANELSAQVGRPGVVEYSARLPDGRTVSIDTDVPGDVMEIVLQGLCSWRRGAR